MHRLAKASLHVKRHLSLQERRTICAGLRLYQQAGAKFISLDAAIIELGELPAIDDNAIDALIHELTTARKVKVCRSKTSSE